MKLDSAKTTTMQPTNLNDTAALVEGNHGTGLAQAMLLCLADAVDDIIAGRVTHLTLGLNQKRTTILLTVNTGDGQKVYVTGDNMQDLAYKWATGIGPAKAAILAED